MTAALLAAGAGAVQDATALNETRTLTFRHTHSNEDLTVTFKRNGRYDEAALKKLNHFLRDWRSQDETTMDRRLFDIIWEVYRDVDAKQPINIISAYRAPATNAMLRRRSSGVARHSQHMLGHAMDFHIPGVPLESIRNAGLRLQRGGVGFYPTSGSPFVHLDTGSIRHWPRMSHDQLARVFPNGRTVHVPSNGQPLAGYQLALAEIEKRRDGDDAETVRSKPSLLTSLFKGGKSSEDDEEGAALMPAPSRAAATSVLAAVVPIAPKFAEAVPMPRMKPASARFQIASADNETLPEAPAKMLSEPPRPPRPVGNAEGKPQTPADIINARGFWDEMPAPKQASPAMVAAMTARQALAQADPQPTGSLDPVFQALAYASPVDRANVVAASAPIPRSIRPQSPARNPMAVTGVTTVVPKLRTMPGVANASRLASASKRDNDVWMRVMILAPSATTAMLATVMGDSDMTAIRAHFIKPMSAISMTFGEDPMMGMNCGSFSGAAVARLATQSFVQRTASLR